MIEVFGTWGNNPFGFMAVQTRMPPLTDQSRSDTLSSS